MPWPRPTLAPGGLAAGAWLGLVALLAVVRSATGWPAAHALAASPDALVAGKLWLLPASGLIVAGAAPAVQIAGTAVLVWIIVRRFGARVFWATAIAAHVGSTVLTYAAIGLLWLVDAHAAGPVVDAPDYGISAVWAGCVGAIAAAGALGELRRRRLVLALGTACLMAFVVLVPAHGELADVEHLIAFVTGATVAVLALHHGARVHGLALRPPRLPSLRRRARAASCPVR